MVSSTGSPLFHPFAIEGLSLSNRIVMAPMTRYFSPQGVPGSDVARYYARRAAAGVGLLITEGTYIPHPSAHSFTNVPSFYGEAALAGWAATRKAVHDAGGRIFPQLWHVGGIREAGMAPDPLVPGFAPSDVDGLHPAPAYPMRDRDVADIIAAYAQAAADAQRLCFDGVEIHGAHGYLIDTFFWDRTNRRTDKWGGDLLARARFGVEIVRAIRKRVGDHFPISFRWSQFKQQDYGALLARTPQELEPFLLALAEAGVTMFHASARRFWEPGFPNISSLSLAGWTKRLSGRPTIAVGSVGLAGVSRISGPADVEGGGYGFAGAAVGGRDQIAMLEKKVADGEFDMIAVGRSLLADPEWAIKIKEARWDERIAFDKAHLVRLQ